VPSWRHPRKRNNQRHSLNLKTIRSLRQTSPLTKPQNSRGHYDPLRPLQSSVRIAFPKPQSFVRLMSTNFHHLWRLTHISHNTPEALLLRGRNRKLRGVFPETAAEIGASPDPVQSCPTPLNLPNGPHLYRDNTKH
jgi:hypothetical protein